MKNNLPFCLLFFLMLFTAASVGNAGNIEEIITLSLEQDRESNKFNIIDPRTLYWPPAYRKDFNLEWIKDHFRKQGFEAGDLLEKLYDINNKETRLTIKSEPEKGYLIDYDLKFRTYLNDGFQKLFKDHPNAGCFISVSIPVYDSVSKIVLIEKHILCAPGPAGVIDAYKYEDGKLIKIGWIMLHK